jgi:type III restriction enzyme
MRSTPIPARIGGPFLIVSPGITIRNRLRVLLPSDPNSYYQQLDLLPPSLREELGKAKVAILNYHAFIRRERNSAASLTKKLLTASGEASPFLETEGQMVTSFTIATNKDFPHKYHKKDHVSHT